MSHENGDIKIIIRAYVDSGLRVIVTLQSSNGVVCIGHCNNYMEFLSSFPF